MSLDYPNRAIWLAYRKPMPSRIRVVHMGRTPYRTGRNAAKRFMRESLRLSRANEVATRAYPERGTNMVFEGANYHVD